MKVFRDESTGYLVIDGIEEGIDILPASLYQGYLKRIKDLEEQNKDLEEQNKDLQVKLANMGCKLADALSAQTEALSAQAEAIKQREDNEARMLELLKTRIL